MSWTVLITYGLMTVLPGVGMASEIASEAPPRCDATLVGKFWPARANTSVNAIGELARSGELKVCARHSIWQYRWEPFTVSLEQLKAQKKKSRWATVVDAVR